MSRIQEKHAQLRSDKQELTDQLQYLNSQIAQMRLTNKAFQETLDSMRSRLGSLRDSCPPEFNNRGPMGLRSPSFINCEEPNLMAGRELAAMQCSGEKRGLAAMPFRHSGLCSKFPTWPSVRPDEACVAPEECPVQGGESIVSPSVNVLMIRGPCGLRNPTSLHVRNIPARYSQDKLLSEWPSAVWGFTFLFLPHSYSTHRSVGYGFVSFMSHELAFRFASRWHRQVLKDQGGNRKLDMSWAEVQGFNDNVLNFRKMKGVVTRNQPAVFQAAQSAEGLQSTRIDFETVLQTLAPKPLGSPSP